MGNISVVIMKIVNAYMKRLLQLETFQFLHSFIHHSEYFKLVSFLPGRGGLKTLLYFLMLCSKTVKR